MNLDYLDIRTIVFAGMVNFVICTLFMVELWRQNRNRLKGLGFMAADFAMKTMAMFLMSQQGILPDHISISLANSLLYAGSVMALMGLERFVGKVRSPVLNLVLLALYTSMFASLEICHASQIFRNLTASIGMLAIWAQIMWLLLHKVEHEMREVTSGVGMFYAGFCLTNIIRIVWYVSTPLLPVNEIQTWPFEALILQTYNVLTISLTISLLLAVGKRLTLELKGQEETFSTAFLSSPYGLTLTRLVDGTVFEANKGFLNMTGYSREEVVGRSTLDLQIWPDTVEHEKVIAELLKNGSVRDREQQFRKRSGELFTGIFSADVISIGARRCIISGYNDISQRKQMEDEIRELSLRDTLTGLLNRRGFFMMVKQKISEADRTGTKLQIAFLDADGLKKINDTLGHEEGDRALQDVASKLRMTFRESDIVARMGGDEFTVCFNKASDIQSERALQRLLDNIAAFNEQHARPYLLSLSCGMATYDPETPRSIDDLLAEADSRMYLQKKIRKSDATNEL